MLHGEEVGTFGYVLAHAYDFLYASCGSHLRHSRIEGAWGLSALEYIAEDEGAPLSACLGASAHEVEGYVERLHVGVVRVVNECAASLAVLHL